MKITITEEIMDYYNNHCLKGTTPLKELDSFVDKKWVALKEVKNIKKELKAEFFKSFGFQTVGVLSKINKILNKAFEIEK